MGTTPFPNEGCPALYISLSKKKRVFFGGSLLRPRSAFVALLLLDSLAESRSVVTSLPPSRDRSVCRHVGVSDRVSVACYSVQRKVII